jgi:hypothetical protein
MFRKKAAGCGLNDGDQVNGLHKFLVFGIFAGRERPPVGLAAQFLDAVRLPPSADQVSGQDSLW